MSGSNHRDDCACQWCIDHSKHVVPTGALAPPTRPDGTRVCGAADALDIVGDRWSLLVIRELMFGVHRYNDIRRLTGAPKETLGARLRRLESAGILERREYTPRPQRFEYYLTQRGAELGGVLTELRAWGEKHAAQASAPSADASLSEAH